MQETIAVLGDKLRSKFDGFHFLVAQRLVTDLELVSGRGLNFFKLKLLCHLDCLDLLPKLILEVVVWLLFLILLLLFLVIAFLEAIFILLSRAHRHLLVV